MSEEERRDMEQEEREVLELVERYERMLSQNETSWFDSMEFLDIIDYYEEAEKEEQMKEALFRAYKLFPDDEEIIIRVTSYYISTGEYQKAERILKKALLKNESDELKGMLASCYVESDTHMRLAEKILTELVAKNSDFPYFNYLLGIVNLKKKKYKKAEELFRKVLNEFSDDESVLSNYVKCIADKTLVDTIISTLSGITDQDPYNDEAWLALAISYFEIREEEKSLECVNYAIAIDTEEETRHALKANIMIARREDDEYIKESLVASEYSDEKFTYYQAIGKVYLHQESYYSAIKYFKKAIEFEQFGISLPESNFGLLECCLMLGLEAEATALLDKVNALDYQAHYYIAFADRLHSLGFLALSKEIFENYLDSEDDYLAMTATISVAYIEAERDNLIDGIKLLKDYINKNEMGDNVYLAMLDLSCRDSRYINYSRFALRYIIKKKEFHKEIENNFPDLLKNNNYIKCLKELMNE